MFHIKGLRRIHNDTEFNPSPEQNYVVILDFQSQIYNFKLRFFL